MGWDWDVMGLGFRSCFHYFQISSRVPRFRWFRIPSQTQLGEARRAQWEEPGEWEEWEGWGECEEIAKIGKSLGRVGGAWEEWEEIGNG